MIGGALIRSVRLPVVRSALSESLGGPLFLHRGQGDIEAFLAQLVAIAQEWNSIAVSFSDCADEQVRADLVSLARAAGLRTELKPGTTEAILRLTDMDPEQVRAGFDQNVRRNIRKAKAGGVQIRSVTESADLELAHHAWMASAGRKGFSSIRPWSTLEPVVRTSLRRDVAQVLASFHGDRMLGAIYVTYMGGIARYVYGGFFDDVDQFRPNHLLHDEAIQNSLARGMAAYSFGTVFDPREPGRHGVDRFKLSFGSALEPGVPTIVWERRPNLLRAFERFKRLSLGAKAQQLALKRLRRG